jgi:hypothetical protein
LSAKRVALPVAERISLLGQFRHKKCAQREV